MSSTTAHPPTCLAGFYRDGRVVLESVAVPSLAGLPAGTALLKTLHCSVCGSDMLCRHRPRPLDGVGASIHEVVAEIVAVVGEQAPLGPGRRVLALPTNYFQTGNYRGLSEQAVGVLKTLPTWGGLAEYFLSHTSHMFALPPQETWAAGVQLCHFVAAQPLGTILWMLRKLPNLLMKSVLVLGVGQNGLIATQMVANMGAREIIAVDFVRTRLAVARQMKATHTVCLSELSHEQAVQHVRELTGGRGADVVLEMVGHQEATVNESLDFAAESGTVVIFGVPASAKCDFSLNHFFRRNITMIGSVFPCACEDFPFAIELIASGRVNLAPIFRGAYALTDAAAAFEACEARGEGGVIKVVITPSGVANVA